MNPGSTPQRIGLRHPANQISDLGGDRWPATFVSALPGPVVLEALPVPPDYGLGLDDDEAFSPSIPGPSQPEPEDAVLGFQPWAFGPSVEDDELLAQSQVSATKSALLMDTARTTAQTNRRRNISTFYPYIWESGAEVYLACSRVRIHPGDEVSGRHRCRS